jgi:hypothetical protein
VVSAPMAMGMSLLQLCLRKIGLSRIDVSPWLKSHFSSLKCVIVVRRDLEMLNLHLC